MAAEWREINLGEVVELKRGYDLPQQARSSGAVPIVSSSGVTDHHSSAMVKGPGVVTGRYGTLGQVFYIQEDFWPLNTTLYVRDFKGNDPRFIAYFLHTIDFLAYSDKAAVPGLNRNHLHQARVRVPVDAGEQRIIAGILGSLDDKIELNRRMNETMDALVQTIFRAMFLERKHEKTGPLSDLVRASREIIDPQAFPDESFLHYSIPAFDAGRVPASELGFEIKSAKLSVPEGSILFSRLNPREPRVWLPDSYGNGYRPICSTEFFIAIPKAEAREREFIYGLFYSQPFLEAARGRAMGTSNSHQRVRPEDVLGIECPVGTTDSRREFSTLVRPLLAQIARNRNEAQVLATTRDAILPKLVSGEIRT